MLLPADQKIRAITKEILELEEEFSSIYFSDEPQAVKKRQTIRLQRQIDIKTDELIVAIEEKHRLLTENTKAKAIADLL